jgi:hypothetical protein
MEIPKAAPLVPQPSPSVWSSKHKSSGTDQILIELIQSGGETLHSEIHKLINYIWNKEELPQRLKESITVPIYKKCNNSDCSNYWGISLLSTSYKILFNILLSRLSPYVDKIIGDHQCGFFHNRSTNDQIFAFIRYWRKKGSTMKQYISYSQTWRMPMIHLGGKYCTTFSQSLGYPWN